MVGPLGNILLVMAFLFSGYSVVAALIGAIKQNNKWLSSAYNSSIAIALLTAVSFLILILGFITNHFEISYVAQHSSRALPLYLKISAVWAGQEGSLLLWCFLQALFTTIALHRPSEKARSLVPWACVILSLVTFFFLFLNLFFSNPFTVSAQIPMDGMGLNPVLRHPGMILHPPILYIGYVGLSIPFAFGLSAVINHQWENWTDAIHGWILLAWLALGFGLLLGMRWAYDVLGWGGFWGWDPVENTGLIPWLAATALLHGSVMQNEKRGFWVWNFWLAVSAFAFVLLGTFTTRSGLVQSVHAYSQSNLGVILIIGILFVLLSSDLVFFNHRKSEPPKQPLPSLISRDGLFFLTLLLLATLTVSILIGSFLPTLSMAFSGQSLELSADWFDRVTGPQFVILVFLLGVCPLIGRAAATLNKIRKRWWYGLAGIAVAVLVAILLGLTLPLALIGFSLAGLTMALIIAEIIDGISKARQSSDPGQETKTITLLMNQQRKYGGLLVHLGIVLMALGIIGTKLYPFEQTVTLASNDTVQLKSLTFQFIELTQSVQADHTEVTASVRVFQGEKYLYTLKPLVDDYGSGTQSLTTPAIQSDLHQDVYVIVGGWEPGGKSATLKIYFNELINFLWMGGMVLLAGGALAIWPRKRDTTLKILVTLLILLILMGAACMMWGLPHGVTREIFSPTLSASIPLQFHLPKDRGEGLQKKLSPGLQFSFEEEIPL